MRQTPFVNFKYRLTGTGWAVATLTDGDLSVDLPASYLSDAPGGLLFALAQLQEGANDATVSWEEEPGEYRWMFHRDGNQVRLDVLAFNSSWPPLPESDGTVVFSSVGRFEDVARSFAEGLREVLTEWGEEGYKSKWVEHGFPTEFLEAVEDHLENA